MADTAQATTLWPEPKQIETHLGTIEYRDVGEGPVVIFLHLILAEASHWDKMPALLSNRFRCIFPTLPMGAHRVAANENADLSVYGLARAVSDLMDALDLNDVTLVGNDSGGAISQVVAVNHPERLGRVVLTNCDMYDDFPPWMFSYFKLLPLVPGSLRVVGPMLKIRAFWPLPFVFGLLANEVDATKINRWADALSASKDIRRDANKVLKSFGPDVTNQAAKALQSTRLPFLLAWGANDKAFKPALAERFCAEIPTARLEMIENCKTLVCWDQPERLAELITEFTATKSCA